MEVRYVKIEPGKPPETITVESDSVYDALHNEIGGWLETMFMSRDRTIIGLCDEEGILKGLPENFLRVIPNYQGKIFSCTDTPIAGTVVFVSLKDEEFMSITEEAVEKVYEMFYGDLRAMAEYADMFECILTGPANIVELVDRFFVMM